MQHFIFTLYFSKVLNRINLQYGVEKDTRLLIWDLGNRFLRVTQPVQAINYWSHGMGVKCFERLEGVLIIDTAA